MYSSGLVLSLWAYLVGRHQQDGVLTAARLWARLCLAALRLFCGITVEPSGLEQLPAGSALIAAQHQSALDIFIWLALLPRPAFVFKSELGKIPIFGTMLIPGGMIPVNRGGGGAALQSMVAGCNTALADGRQIILFPEGTRVATGKRATLRHGITAVAHSTNTEIFPAATNSGQHWGARAFGKTPGPVHLKIFAPLPPTLLRDEIMAELIKDFYDLGAK